MNATRGELWWLRAGTASIWLLTALGVLHPYYREVGHAYLAQLGLPDALMWLACAGELALALIILTVRPATWLMAAQVAGVAFFTLVLGALEPMLLVHPYGVLSKNYPFVALVVTTWLVSREGWSARATWWLRGGMALVWVTEGLFPKVFFQQPLELAVVAGAGVPMSPGVFLMLLGVAQAASGVLAVVLKGPLLRALVAFQAASLIILPLAVSWQDPTLWFHPFGPMTKNVPILFGTLLVVHRLGRR